MYTVFGAWPVAARLIQALLVGILHKRLATPGAELILAHHANTARDEMQTLAEEFHELARQSGRQTPAIDALYGYLDPSTPPLPEAQANLRLDWRSIAVTGAAAADVLVSAGLLIGWQLKRQKK